MEFNCKVTQGKLQESLSKGYVVRWWPHKISWTLFSLAPLWFSSRELRYTVDFSHSRPSLKFLWGDQPSFFIESGLGSPHFYRKATSSLLQIYFCQFHIVNINILDKALYGLKVSHSQLTPRQFSAVSIRNHVHIARNTASWLFYVEKYKQKIRFKTFNFYIMIRNKKHGIQ